MKTKGFGWASAILAVAWLGVASEARAGEACDIEVCPDDVRVCVTGSGQASIHDEIGGCTYFGTGKVKPNEKQGFVKVSAKGENDSPSCQEKAKVNVKYDPETGQCIKKAKVKVGSEKREVETPAPCECEPSGAFCGDGTCDPEENSVFCPEDCSSYDYGGGDSCAEAGCGGSASGCFCDADCLFFNDCCADACSVCGHCPG